MTPAEARADYRSLLEEWGETVTITRGATSLDVRARVTGYKPEEMAGGMQQGDRKIIVLADDVTFEEPLDVGDKAMVRGTLLYIEAVDDNTRRIDGQLIAYELRARGA